MEDIRSVDHSPKSSYASTTSSGTLTSDARPSFAGSGLEKHCRPLDEVMMEVETKGTLIDRLVHAEDRILKMCLHLEEEFEAEKSRELKKPTTPTTMPEKKSPKKGLKSLVKSCVGGKKLKHKNNNV